MRHTRSSLRPGGRPSGSHRPPLPISPSTSTACVRRLEGSDRTVRLDAAFKWLFRVQLAPLMCLQEVDYFDWSPHPGAEPFGKPPPAKLDSDRLAAARRSRFDATVYPVPPGPQPEIVEFMARSDEGREGETQKSVYPAEYDRVMTCDGCGGKGGRTAQVATKHKAVERQVTEEVSDACEKCSGNGEVWADQVVTIEKSERLSCSGCCSNGSVMVEDGYYDPNGNLQAGLVSRTCRSCFGSGYSSTRTWTEEAVESVCVKCEPCGGRGGFPRQVTKTVVAHVPCEFRSVYVECQLCGGQRFRHSPAAVRTQHQFVQDTWIEYCTPPAAMFTDLTPPPPGHSLPINLRSPWDLWTDHGVKHGRFSWVELAVGTVRQDWEDRIQVEVRASKAEHALRARFDVYRGSGFAADLVTFSEVKPNPFDFHMSGSRSRLRTIRGIGVRVTATPHVRVTVNDTDQYRFIGLGAATRYGHRYTTDDESTW